MIAPNFSGFSGGVFYVRATPSRRLVEWAESQGLLKFPSVAVRNYSLGQGPRPESAFDSLPDEAEAEQK